ncbi:MAG TPA: ABC transporter substrate-binding protein [Allosphingosinicella sp.]|jgi:peptide/nickel transport system substrate-binding protein
MTSRRLLLAAAAALLALTGCRKSETGPIEVSAIGAPPRLADPNRRPLDAAAAFLLQSTAQGLVRFDAGGDIEPGLAQSWIISNDGLRYTFRLARAQWRDGSRVTAEQVVARLKAAAGPASRNPLKPILGAIDEIETMTDEVLEISLKSPRPNFLQLLAQPEMAIVRAGEGIGPFLARPRPDGTLLLTPPPLSEEEQEDGAARPPTPLVLRGETAGMAVARFDLGTAELVVGGTAGDLPVARAAEPRAASLVFDPAAGLFGLAFAAGGDGPLSHAEARQALSMAIDRGTLVAALGVPGLQPRESLLPAGIEGLATPAAPAWTASPLPARRAAAAEALRPLLKGIRLHVRVSLPEGPGYRLVFAYLRRDWATIGVEAERVGPGAPADLALLDEVAPVALASWYLRHFTCPAGAVCDPAADTAMDAARLAPNQEVRRGFLTTADRLLAGAAPFIPIAAPVRWSLVSPRLSGFRPNAFARHPAGELIRATP